MNNPGTPDTPSKRNLVLFDLDGTLTFKDSMLDFLYHAVGKKAVLVGMSKCSWILLKYKLGMLDNSTAKELILMHFFSGWEIADFQTEAARYAECGLPKILRIDAMKTLSNHLDMGDEVCVVTASIEDWISPWSKAAGVELVATKLHRSLGKITGTFSTKNCYGPEKVVRIKAKYDLSKFDKIHAYGDSKGDLEMLELADFRHFRVFKSNHVLM